ncbi:hypothetical protein CCR75_009698 [Bremia lactucae]|uniref:Uncharacterized protein n=1 Tax=Bremia lactucae TaxID=4779 RepID=A0A976FK51_BRELC|nr:hypothetical protein CCR75_009698 [Bremia lactucae]
MRGIGLKSQNNRHWNLRQNVQALVPSVVSQGERLQTSSFNRTVKGGTHEVVNVFTRSRAIMNGYPARNEITLASFSIRASLIALATYGTVVAHHKKMLPKGGAPSRVLS